MEAALPVALDGPPKTLARSGGERRFQAQHHQFQRQPNHRLLPYYLALVGGYDRRPHVLVGLACCGLSCISVSACVPILRPESERQQTTHCRAEIVAATKICTCMPDGESQ